ncbi:MAG: hypothetical protein RJA49_3133, partial [Actinomycetota bacterium]
DDGEAGTGVATPPGSGGLNTPVDVVGVTGAVAISAGGKGSGVPGDLFHSHTCVVLKTDAVKCWGSNLDSDLGLGTPGSSPSPVTVVGFSGATAISAGGTDTCAVVANGRAVCGGFSGSLLNLGQVTSGWGHSCGLFGSFAACWGTNQFGELGNASPGPTNVEAQVSGLANASAIAAGGFRSCAILFTQHVSCWGQGPLGNGTTTDSPTPVEVTGITTAIEVAVGDTTACARLADLTVQCWGVNAHGEAGDGTTNVASSPVAVAGLTQAQSISVGVSSACAVVTGGAIFCWGANDQGQLGDGTNTASLAMVQVAGITNATQVSVGGYQNHGFGLLPQRAHACAVLADHSVQCWGANDHGELGDGTTTDSNSPVAVSGIATANTVRAGGFHSCALMTGGVVKCWGSNAEHQLGDGRYPVPAVVPLVKARHTPPPTITALVQNAGRGNSVITITGTNLLGITAVRFGTIGSPLVTVVNSTRITAKVPTNLLPPGKITVATLAGAVTSSAVFTQTFPPKSLTAGGAHSCALTDTHTVLCWGSNSSGQLGIGNHTSSTSPRIVPGLVEPVAVSAGGLFTCAVNGVHAARCWGSNSNGQLGTGTTTASALPVTVSGSGFTGSQLPVVSVATGTAFACATIFDGAGDYVRCWGQNSSGQLGDGTLTQRTRWVPVLVAPGRPLHGIRTIAAGGNTACAILLNAQLWCWGSNNHGQLGRGTLTNSRYAVQVNGFNGVTLKAKSVSVGANHVCALITDGSERCWGSNSAGQLGDGTTIQRTVPTAVLTAPRAKLTGVTAIAAGGLHSCAIIGSGSAARGRCWGSDAAGQLGNTTAGNLRYATLLSGTQADGIRFIAAGGLHTLAIATSRLLGAPGSAGWGLNTSGQLGDGTTVSKPTLTPSPFL